MFKVLQKIGKAFMLPIAILPAAGLLLGIGGALSNPVTVATYPVLNMSLKNMFLCHSGLILSIPYMSYCLAFCIFICIKKPQDINGLKKNHYLCIRISFPKK